MTFIAFLTFLAAAAAAVAAKSSADSARETRAHPYKAILLERRITTVQCVLTSIVSVHEALVELVRFTKQWLESLNEYSDLAEVWAIRPPKSKPNVAGGSENLIIAAKEWRDCTCPDPRMDPADAKDKVPHLTLIAAVLTDMGDMIDGYANKVSHLRHTVANAMCVMSKDDFIVIAEAVKSSEEIVGIFANFANRDKLDEEQLDVATNSILELAGKLVDDLRRSADIEGLSEGLVHDLIRAPNRSPQIHGSFGDQTL